MENIYLAPFYKREIVNLRSVKYFYLSIAALGLQLSMTAVAMAQDLDPRAYARIPTKTTFLVAGLGYSYGGIIVDATLPIQDLEATIQSPSVGGGYSFSFLGQTAQVSAAIPFAWAEASGAVLGSARSTSRTGFSDMRLRFSTLLLGAPALTAAEMAVAPHRTIVGASISVVAPTGQYFSEKLINLGNNRWAFKPEIALSQPIGKKWLFDLYAGLWMFTPNNAYFTGNSVRRQDMMGSFQSHISYNLSPRMWAALDLTFYTGGESTIDGVASDDRQENSRIGGTLVVPIQKRHSLKFAFSTGAIIRSGANFTSISAGWQTFFLAKPKKQ